MVVNRPPGVSYSSAARRCGSGQPFCDDATLGSSFGQLQLRVRSVPGRSPSLAATSGGVRMGR